MNEQITISALYDLNETIAAALVAQFNINRRNCTV